MGYTYIEETLLEGKLSSLKNVKIKDLEDICDYFGVKVLVTNSFIQRNQDDPKQKDAVLEAEKELSEYQTILLNAQELLRDLREKKRKNKQFKKSNHKKDYDWDDYDRSEFLESETEFADIEDSKNDDPDLYERMAEYAAEWEEDNKYFGRLKTQSEPEPKPETSPACRFFQKLKSLVC